MAKKEIRLIDPDLANVKTDIKWGVVTARNIDDVIDEAMTQKAVAYDLETTGTKWHKGITTVGLALAWGGRAHYFPLRHKWCNVRDMDLPPNAEWSRRPPLPEHKNLPFDMAIEKLRPLVSSRKVKKSGAYIQFDMRISHYDLGLEVEGAWDIGALSRLRRSYDSSKLSDLMIFDLDRFHWEEQHLKKVFMPAMRLKFGPDNDKVPIATMGAYNGADVVFTDELFWLYLNELKPGNQFKLARLEARLLPILADMEKTGVPVNEPYLRRLSEMLGQKMLDKKREAQKAVGFDINPNSGVQVGVFMFGPKGRPKKATKTITIPSCLGLKPLKWSDGGVKTDRVAKVDGETLLHYSSQEDAHPLLKLVMDYRSLKKIKDTYIDGNRGILNNTFNGIVYPDIAGDAAKSGRLAAREPSLMNIPVRETQMIRKAFIAQLNDEDPFVGLLFADASQIEVKIFIHYLNDDAVSQSIYDGVDFHRMTASIMFGVPYDEVTKKQRNTGKTCNFAVIYGAGPLQLVRQLGVSFKEAVQLMNTYHAKIPWVKPLQEKVVEVIYKDNYVSTYFGRERFFPRQFAYAALNHVIQGTAAEVLKFGLHRSYHDLIRLGLKSKIVLTIHDEIIVRHHRDDDIFEVIGVLNDALTDYPFRVPLTTGIKYTTTNWSDCQEIEVGDRWLKQDWRETKDWVNQECREFGHKPSKIIEQVGDRYPRLSEQIREQVGSIHHTLKYSSHLMTWKERLNGYRSGWEEVFRAYSAA